MQLFLQLIVNGIIIGAIYSLASLGYALPFSVKINNFSHGSVLMLGSYVAYLLLKYYSMPLWLIFLFVVATGFLLGILIFYASIKAFLTLSNWTIIVASTLAIAVILENVVLAIHGFESFGLRQYLHEPNIFELHGMVITEIQISLLIFSLFIQMSIFIILKKSKIGLKFRAVADDPIAAELMGISKNKIILCSLMIGCALASGTGALIALDYDQHASIGSAFLMKSYTATVIGGTEKLQNIVIASFMIGILENLVAGYISTEYKLASVFIILIVFLLVRKSGLGESGLTREV
jgi:branched-chain amino acid transport system permease protein